MPEARIDVSIILTSYNYERFLPRAIQSARAQGVPNLEILVVDNASTDGSWAIIEAAAAEDARIRAYRNDTNIGMVPNHNRGLELARGERVLFLSADDMLLPGHVARLLAAHSMHPEIDVFYSSYFKVDEAENILQFVGHIGHLRGNHGGGRNEFADLLTYDCYMCTPTTLWNKEELLRGGGFDTGLIAGDLELCLRLAAQGKQFGFLDVAGACIRVHEREITGEQNYVSTGRQLLDHLYLMERYVTTEQSALIAGREHGLARLLNAKINNLRGYPEIAARILPQEEARIQAIAGRLNELLQRSRTSALSPTPVISVVVHCGEDAGRAIECIRGIVQQHYPQTELVLVVEGRHDISPMLISHAPGIPARVVVHSGSHGRAAALNDALKLASGDIVTYADAAAEWPAGHLQRVAASFSANAIEALVAPVDLLVVRNGKPVTRMNAFAGASIAQPSAFIGEAVPLFAFAHRRRVVDQFGGFEERLAHLCEFEFVRRVFAHTSVGLQDNGAVTLRRAVDEIHPALADPRGYLNSLQAVYNASQMETGMRAQAQEHLQRLQRSISRAASAADAGGTFRFWSDVRGAQPARGSNNAPRTGRPRVLVIDDRVPYRELGRGYPRAHDILDELKAIADVTFYPLLVPFDEEPLAQGIEGVEILYGRGTQLLAGTLDELLPETDVLWVSRPHNMDLVRKALDGIPHDRDWKLVYDAEAIYAHRDIVKAQLAGAPLDEQTQRRLVDREVALLQGADALFAVSDADRGELAQRCASPVRVLSFRLDPAPASHPFEERSGLLFVGAIEPGSPNEDALAWFVEHVAPLLAGQLPGTRAVHAGVMSSDALRARAATLVDFAGIVPDLRGLYARAKVFIAPTRFAAGLPQKVYEAAANGLPVVATSLIAQQLGWQHERELLVADTPQQWLEAIRRLSGEAHLWHGIRSGALEAVRREVAPGIFASRIAETIADLVPQTALSAKGGVPLRQV